MLRAPAPAVSQSPSNALAPAWHADAEAALRRSVADSDALSQQLTHANARHAAEARALHVRGGVLMLWGTRHAAPPLHAGRARAGAACP